MSEIKKMKRIRKQWILAGILFLFWIPWGILCFPGNMPYDAGTSIAWFTGLDRSNVNNPYFQNILFGSFYSLGKGLGIPEFGVCLYCWLQMALEAILLGHVIAYIYDKWAGKAAYILVAFYALIPVFPLYAFMMGKDSNLAIGILWFIYLLLKSAGDREEFWAKKSNRVWVAITPAILSLLRNFAGWIPLIIAIVLLLIWRKKEGILPACLSAALLVIVSIAIPRIAGIPSAEIKEEMSMPLQTAAYYVQQHEDEVTPEEKEIITSVVDWDMFTYGYNPNLADRIKDVSTFTPETRAKFLGMWWGMFRKHPGTILEGWWKSMWIYFAPSEQSPVKSHVFFGVNINPELRAWLGLSEVAEGNYTAADIWNWAINVPVLRQLQCIGLYSWIAVALTLIALIFRKLRKFLPCCLMLIMVLVACMLGPVNGYYRYAYPMILSTPVVFTAMTGCFMKELKKA